MTADTSSLATWAIFAFVYAGLAVGKLPFIRIDRAGIALVGATAMLITGLVTLPEAVAAVDLSTIVLLFGMMVVVAYLRLGGFFRRLAGWLLTRARSPRAILAATIALTGVLSAFLVNDVVCLAMGPVVLSLARRARRDPVPFLVALATAANLGSVATITGNPQNMIIGALAHIPYTTFSSHLAPVAAMGLVLDYFAVTLAFRRTLAAEVDEAPASILPHPDPAGEPTRELLPKGIVVLLGLVVLFFTGAPIELVALGAASVLLLGRVRPERLYAQIDWSLLVMFVGLFVVVNGFERHVVSGWDLARLSAVDRPPVAILTVVSAALSNLVSNVPAVLLLKSAVASMAASAQSRAWLTVAMASTLAGNLTPIASVANLIVIEGAKKAGVKVSIGAYCRVGVPVTLATLAVGAGWLAWGR